MYQLRHSPIPHPIWHFWWLVSTKFAAQEWIGVHGTVSLLSVCVYLSGIAQNKTEAVRLYRDAAAQGSSAAVERLNVLHQHQSANKGFLCEIN